MPIFTAEERIGQTVAGKYRLDRILGDGGMGVVYDARHTTLGRAVAVKFLHVPLATQEDVVERFLNEARAASSLAHPNVVDVLDVGTADDGAPYIVMERLEGESLASRIARVGPLSLDETHAVLRPAMEAIAFAHERQVVHRDLKPDNVFVHRNAKGESVTKVLDFGIAKLASEKGRGTATGALLGTVFYMSPEQSRGRGVGAWSDVWAMGVVWYETLTGRFPFDFDHGSPTTDVLIRLSTERPIPIATLVPSLPRAVAKVIDRALSQDVAARYADMGEMLRALDGALAGELGTPPTSVVEAGTTLGTAGGRTEKKRSPAIVLGLGLGLITVAALAATAALPAATSPTVARETPPATHSAPSAREIGSAPVAPPLARGIDPPEAPLSPAPSAPAPSAPAPSARHGATATASAEDHRVAVPTAEEEREATAGRAHPPREEVLSAMGRIAPALRACGEYQHGIARVRVYVAGRSGHVTRAIITGALSGTVAGSCVARGLRGLAFPPFDDREFVFTYPIDI